MSQTVYSTREGQKFAGDTTLEVVTCATCGMPYAIPASLVRSALKYHGDRPNGWKLCCPLGHQWWYCDETKEERLLRERDWARQQRDTARRQREQAENQARAEKAAKTRIRNDRDRIKGRVAAGVCPCCNRSFQNLSRHMASQHPDFTEDGAE